jgi:hypothetical protein
MLIGIGLNFWLFCKALFSPTLLYQYFPHTQLELIICSCLWDVRVGKKQVMF